MPTWSRTPPGHGGVGFGGAGKVGPGFIHHPGTVSIRDLPPDNHPGNEDAKGRPPPTLEVSKGPALLGLFSLASFCETTREELESVTETQASLARAPDSSRELLPCWGRTGCMASWGSLHPTGPVFGGREGGGHPDMAAHASRASQEGSCEGAGPVTGHHRFPVPARLAW